MLSWLQHGCTKRSIHLINYAPILPQDAASFIYTASPFSTGQGILGYACTPGPLECIMIVQSEAYPPHNGVPINYAQILPQDVATFIFTASPLSTGQGILGYECTQYSLGCSMGAQSKAYAPHQLCINPTTRCCNLHLHSLAIK
jgi:hypothetical protein